VCSARLLRPARRAASRTDNWGLAPRGNDDLWVGWEGQTGCRNFGLHDREHYQLHANRANLKWKCSARSTAPQKRSRTGSTSSEASALIPWFAGHSDRNCRIDNILRLPHNRPMRRWKLGDLPVLRETSGQTYCSAVRDVSVHQKVERRFDHAR